MARRGKRSKFRLIITTALFALTCFGGYVLYKRHHVKAEEGIARAAKAYKAAKKEIVRKTSQKK